MVQYIDRYGWMYLYSTTPPVKRLFSIVAATRTEKRASLTSRNFEGLAFLKGNLDFLQWQGIAQDSFDDMPSTSNK